MRSASVVVLGALVAAACGGSSDGGMGSTGGTTTAPGTPPAPSSSGSGTGGGGGGSFVITVSGLSYSPLNLAVPPGATVTVKNLDGTAHSVTSETAPGAFTPGLVGGVSFDTGAFSSGSRTFSIPATAAAGTVIPFYCTVHLAMMATPNGTVTVTPGASPTTTPSTPSTPTTPTPMPGMPY